MLSPTENQPNNIVIGDDSNFMMPYTQEATIKTHFHRLKGFIKLTDCLVLDAKLQMCRLASQSVLNDVEDLNLAFKSFNIFQHVCWIKSEVFIDGDKILYNPSVS